MSFLAVQSSHLWLLCFNCVLAVVCLLVFSVSLPRGAMAWSVIAAFPDHTHLLSKYKHYTTIAWVKVQNFQNPELFQIKS